MIQIAIVSNYNLKKTIFKSKGLSFIARKNWNMFFIVYDILIANYFSLTQKELQYPLVLGHPKRLIQHTVRRYYLGVYVVCVCREKKNHAIIPEPFTFSVCSWCSNLFESMRDIKTFSICSRQYVVEFFYIIELL